MIIVDKEIALQLSAINMNKLSSLAISGSSSVTPTSALEPTRLMDWSESDKGKSQNTNFLIDIDFDIDKYSCHGHDRILGDTTNFRNSVAAKELSKNNSGKSEVLTSVNRSPTYRTKVNSSNADSSDVLAINRKRSNKAQESNNKRKTKKGKLILTAPVKTDFRLMYPTILAKCFCDGDVNPLLRFLYSHAEPTMSLYGSDRNPRSLNCRRKNVEDFLSGNKDNLNNDSIDFLKKDENDNIYVGMMSLAYNAFERMMKGPDFLITEQKTEIVQQKGFSMIKTYYSITTTSFDLPQDYVTASYKKELVKLLTTKDPCVNQALVQESLDIINQLLQGYRTARLLRESGRSSSSTVGSGGSDYESLELHFNGTTKGFAKVQDNGEGNFEHVKHQDFSRSSSNSSYASIGLTDYFTGNIDEEWDVSDVTANSINFKGTEYIVVDDNLNFLSHCFETASLENRPCDKSIRYRICSTIEK